MTLSAELRLVDDDRVERGFVTIACLPGGDVWRGIPRLELLDSPPGQGRSLDVSLLEESDYRYHIELASGEDVEILEPIELFSPDSSDKLDGRIRTGRVTGTIVVIAETKTGRRLKSMFEVRSRKLDFESEYRNMMLRLAEESAELLQSSFAPGQFVGFEPDKVEDAETLYQRFAFVASHLESEMFAEAVDVIRHRPHTKHEAEEELIDPSQSVKPDRRLVKQFVMARDRQPVGRPVARLLSVPRTIVRRTHVESFDTIPNRFVRYSFEHWRALARQVGEILSGSGPTAERGRREAGRIEAMLDHYLSMPPLADVGRLTRLPTSNTVLTARAGYREVYRSFLVSELATSLKWDGGEDVFGAGQCDVATLYEYWIFLELARAIKRLDGFEFNRSSLVSVGDDGLSLQLSRDRKVVLKGHGRRRGRKVELELWFNRTFSPGDDSDRTWSVTMRPDCSLRITPKHSRWPADTWVHFDAKYRIDYSDWGVRYGDDAGERNAKVEPGLSEGSTGRPNNDDLRKMHSYRDAIRRTAGAYVLYPGDDSHQPSELRQYHEVLPGIGAFVLRPTANGESSPEASSHLVKFLSDVIDHAAAQGTGRERAQYWEDVTYRDHRSTDDDRRLDFNADLRRPPADETVLLGFVRSDDHRAWIREHGLYNLRADKDRHGSVGLGSPEVRAGYLALYDAHGDEVDVFDLTGALYIRTGEELRSMGYPTAPGSSGTGNLYLCLELGKPIDLQVTGDVARSLAGGASPKAVTWEAFDSARST